jgi:hypothetical protein
MWKRCFQVFCLIVIYGLLWSNNRGSFATPINLKQENQCPTDLENLTVQLLNDLPNYANRVIQRARRLDREIDSYYTVIIAGKPEFEPIELLNFEYTPFSGEQAQQVFFTTLERSYDKDRVIQSQSYHWLFLTHSNRGWQTVMIYSQNGSTSPNDPPAPARESSDSFIGQGVKIWLRDCNAR